MNLFKEQQARPQTAGDGLTYLLSEPKKALLIIGIILLLLIVLMIIVFGVGVTSFGGQPSQQVQQLGGSILKAFKIKH